MYKNKLKMDFEFKSKCKTGYYKIPQGKHGQNTPWHKS